MAGIFKAYDIRGIVGEGLTPERAYLIGRGLAAEVFMAQGPIAVSRDMRTHSPAVAAQLIRGLSEGGCSVIDMGLCATPMNYWGNNQYQARGSVQVTASHNGPEYNGFKVSGQGATPLDFSTGLDKVEMFVNGAEANGAPATGAPADISQAQNVLQDYLNWMDGFVAPHDSALKIGVDCANGMGGFFLPDFFEKHPNLQAVPLYWELDGTFPNHEADPLKAENLRDVQQLVRAENLDFGVAYDGDADRCMFVDESGKSISSDLITALIAQEMLEHTPQSPILYDLRSSHVVPEWIESHGGVPVRGRVGHSFMKRLLKEKGARFGGELSGHYYFQDCFNTDSGLMAMIQVINICQKRGQKLSELIVPLRKYAATGEINYRVQDTQETLQKIEAHYASQGAKLDHLDGLTVEMPDWWFNLRSSNTEPLLRLNLEANDDAQRDAHLQEVQQILGAQPVAGH